MLTAILYSQLNVEELRELSIEHFESITHYIYSIPIIAFVMCVRGFCVRDEFKVPCAVL